MEASDAVGYLLGFAKGLTPSGSRSRMAHLFDRGTDFLERLAGVKDDLTPPVRIRLHIGPLIDARVYRASGKRDVENLQKLSAIRPNDRILDVGCGCGRLAVALTSYLESTGTYEGFDAAKDPVDWCRQTITPRFSNFNFRSTDTFSGRYNPSGRASASDLVFPYQSDYFDLAFCGSVYIHMPPDEVRNFVKETARVLRPGGVALATFCLLNETTLPLVRAGTSTLKLPFELGDSRVRNATDPTRFIGHPESFIRELYSESGLTVMGGVRYGRWALPPSEVKPFQEDFFSQDVILASKAR